MTLLPRTTQAVYKEFSSEIREIQRKLRALKAELNNAESHKIEQDIQGDILYENHIVNELLTLRAKFIADPKNY